MPTQTHSTHSAGSGQAFTLPKPPAIPTGREIYDSIMRQIEPELVSGVIPTLKGKYKNETEEGKKTRGERYRKAFIRYYEMFEAYISDLDLRIRRYRREAMAGIEAISHGEEERKLNDIAASMFKLA